jgi:hypothetical protein
MNKQFSIQKLLYQIEYLTSTYHFALRGNGNPRMMISYLNSKGFSYDFSPEEKSIDPSICLLIKETVTNELDFLHAQVKNATRQEIASRDCVPTA